MTVPADAMERARAHVKADVVTLVPFCDECEANCERDAWTAARGALEETTP